MAERGLVTGDLLEPLVLVLCGQVQADDDLAVALEHGVHRAAGGAVAVGCPAFAVPAVPTDLVDVEQLFAERPGQFDGHAEVPRMLDGGGGAERVYALGLVTCSSSSCGASPS